MVFSQTLPVPPPLRELCEEGPVSLFLDFDGTLVELAPTPEAIRPVPDLAQRLHGLSQQLEGRFALVSGRAIEDIEKHIGTLAMARAGSHGSDVRDAKGAEIGPPPIDFPEGLAAEMRAFASDHGLDYETKPHGGALHFRSDPGLESLVSAFANELAATHGWKAQAGKCVVELVKGDTDKGSAVRALMSSDIFVRSKPVFIGDDLTDEAGFAACISLGGEGILVGERDETCASFRLPDVACVHRWLGIEDQENKD